MSGSPGAPGRVSEEAGRLADPGPEYIYAGDRLIGSDGLESTPPPAVTRTDDLPVAGTTVVKAVHPTELRPR